jgi:hypothetical protein
MITFEVDLNVTLKMYSRAATVVMVPSAHGSQYCNNKGRLY